MKKKMFASFGLREFLPKERSSAVEEFFQQLQIVFAAQYDIEECVPVQLTNGRYVWSSNSHSDLADVLVVVLFERPAYPIEFIVRQQEGLQPIPVIILGGFTHPLCSRDDYTNVGVTMNQGGPYKFCTWMWSNLDAGLIHINEFLKERKLPFSD